MDKTVVRVCPSARKALTFYRTRYASWLEQRGVVFKFQPRKLNSCPWVRTLAKRWKVQARAARLALERWHWRQYAWRRWLPPVWIALARCETYLTWTWDSGSYVSAFGIARDGYAADAHRIGNLSWDETLRKLKRYPTPREQWNAALSHYRAHGGFSGWGCA